MSASLMLGNFNLIQTAPSTAAPWTAKVLTDGTERGNPVPIEVQVQSWLQDGAVVVTQGHGNREVPVKVKLGADTLPGVGAAEQGLFAELERPNTLTWTPNQALVQPVVFVVVTSSLDHESATGWDSAEVASKPSARYQIRLVCEAFVRSATELTAVVLPAAGSTTTTLDTCAATTGWSGTVNGTSVSPSVVSGAVVVSASAQWGKVIITAQKTFAATTTSTKVLVVDWKPSVPGAGLVVVGDGTKLPLVADAASPTSGFTRSWYYVAASSLAVTKFSQTSAVAQTADTSAAPVRSLSIDNVAVTDTVLPTVGTGRQQLRALEVTGSAPAPGSLSVESTTAALGDSLVYVYGGDDKTNGYTPPLRQFRTAGNTVTADATRVSGSREPLNSPGITFTVPIALFPAGTYLLMARIATSSATDTTALNVTTQTVLGGNNIGPATAVTAILATSTTYQNYVLTKLQLPTVDLDPKTPATMQIVLSAPVGHNTLVLDEAWLFNRDLGQLIWADCLTGAGAVGAAARRLFVEPPSPGLPRPTLRIGHSADRSDAYYPASVKSWQLPRFPDGQVNVFAVTPNATDAVINLRYYPRWHTIPAA